MPLSRMHRVARSAKTVSSDVKTGLLPGTLQQPSEIINPSSEASQSGIGVFPVALLREIPLGQKMALLPFFADWIVRGLVRGEVYRRHRPD